MLHNKFSLAVLIVIALSMISVETSTNAYLVERIRKIPMYKIPENLQSICLNDLEDKACRKTVAGINQCLILNECFTNWSDEMSTQCWNCWADYTTDSHLISQFQDQVRKCNFADKITSLFGILVIVFIALLF